MDLIELLTAYGSVAVTSMFKFLFGPLFGVKFGLSYPETAILTGSGMMLSVFIFTFFGRQARSFILRKRKKRVFTSRNRKIVRIWRKYGIFGIAFLTPVFLSPVIGTLIAVSFGEKRHRIFVFMAFSAYFWAFAQTALAYLAYDLFMQIVEGKLF